jgi:predicted methyltransferase
MTSSDKKTAAAEMTANAMMDFQTTCVGEFVATMKRMGNAEGGVSKTFADFVDKGMEASIAAQKDVMRIATEALSSKDPQTAMALPQQLMQKTMQQSMEHSIRNMQFAQTLFAQIYHVAKPGGEK